jgi:hypothetical protein
MSYGNYGKKDEDADLGLVKVDRVQVFQEGECLPEAHSIPHYLEMVAHEPVSQLDYSTAPQFSREDVGFS